MDLDTIKIEQLTDKVTEMTLFYAPKLVLAIITLVAGLWLISVLVRGMQYVMEKRDLDLSLRRWLSSILGLALKICLLISVISMIGVQTTSFIAMLGAAGLAVGLALQGSLSNFAGGVLILFFKPYRVGDYIKTDGEEGFVEVIDIFYTVLRTLDSRHVIMPNGPLANGNLVNFTRDPNRRLDLTVGISYQNKFEDAEAALLAMVREDPRVLAEPAPFVGVTGYGDSSIDLTIRTWCRNEDFWTLRFSLNKGIKPALDAAGGTIPFPPRGGPLIPQPQSPQSP